jgi:general stress protein YciG
MGKPKRLVKYSEEWYEAMRKAGRRGGRANVRKHGSEHMARIGFKGSQELIKRKGGPEKAKEFFSMIGSLPKTRKEDDDVQMDSQPIQ